MYDTKAASYIEHLSCEYDMTEEAKDILEAQIQKHLLENPKDKGQIILAIEEDVASLIDDGFMKPKKSLINEVHLPCIYF